MERENQLEKGFCEIKVKGKLEPHWEEWFDSMNIKVESDSTIISGFIADQSALQGVMEKISMFGLAIISIKYNENNIKLTD